MLKSSKTALHDRVVLLVEIFDDRDFRADNGNFDDFEAAILLDRYLEDTSVSFLEARAILEVFPNPADWAKMSLRDLYEKALEKQKPIGEDLPKRTRRAVTMKELEDAELATKEYASRCAFLTKEKTGLEKKVAELEAENRRLVVENANLEGRIVELERICNREFASK